MEVKLTEENEGKCVNKTSLGKVQHRKLEVKEILKFMSGIRTPCLYCSFDSMTRKLSNTGNVYSKDIVWQ
jgi:hypothetical protein